MHLNKEMNYTNEHIKALLVEKLAGTISPEDELLADAALAESPEALAYWHSLEQKFNATGRPAKFLSDIDVEKSWEAVNNRILGTEITEVAPTVGRFRTWHYIAASAAILAVVFMGLLWTREPKNPIRSNGTNQVRLQIDGGQTVDLSADRQIDVEGAEISNRAKELSYVAATGTELKWATLSVPHTKDYKVKLDDGTTVWLNAASTLRFPFRFSAAKREVYLTGEAYFEVAKNKKVPFVVHTNFADIQVHGTAFNVNAYENESFSASLVEGSVSAVKENKEVILQPGQEVFSKSDGLGLRSFDPELLSWRNGTYYFHRKPLAEIAQVLVRWYDVKLDWKTAATSSQTFTGEIDKSQPLEVVLSNLQLTSGINSKLQNGVLTFY
ncbi:FecR family protein [Pedobacter ureilyticus]|uniref:FecR family protein n=1 Tax=Pedobacter ureilyticus TaxID=1393051 RepID=A0ABW9J7Y8_9SPHI|nr:FecR domain-containing protein [Pedobacter helvus]